MTEADRDRFTAKLNEFSSRLDAHLILSTKVSLPTRIELTEGIGRQHDQIQKKRALAKANGTAWDVITSEVERDFSSLFDDLQQAVEQLDADEMKAK
jgi:hypothetical protein